MNIALVFVLVLVAVWLIILVCLQPVWPRGNTFDLKRHAQKSDEIAVHKLKQRQFFSKVLFLRSFFIILSVALFSVISAILFNFLIAISLILVILLIAFIAAKTKLKQIINKKIYLPYEDVWMNLAKSVNFLNLQNNLKLAPYHESSGFESIEEIEEALSKSPKIINHSQLRRVKKAIEFEKVVAADIMTHRDEIDVVQKDEMMGPLTLDDLHKTGHTHFPVIDDDLDEMLGVLSAPSLFVVRNQTSQMASELMNTEFSKIDQDMPVSDLLKMFIKTHEHIMFVINENQKIIGLVSITDVIEALTGPDMIK